MSGCQNITLFGDSYMSIYFGYCDRTVTKHFLYISNIHICIQRLVANVCRNICGVICISIDASSVYLFIIRRTAWSDKGFAAWLTKKESQASISFESYLIFFKIQAQIHFQSGCGVPLIPFHRLELFRLADQWNHCEESKARRFEYPLQRVVPVRQYLLMHFFVDILLEPVFAVCVLQTEAFRQ